MTRRLMRMGLVLITLTALAAGTVIATTRLQESEAPIPEDPQTALENAAAIESVAVLFVSNRRQESQDAAEIHLGGQRGEPTFGICRVSFRPIPGLGGIAQKVPLYVPTETSDLQVELDDEPAAFWDRLSSTVQVTPPGDVVVFVHGYSYDFERSCDRAAEAQRVLEGQATVLLFTWPSDGDATGYVSDQTDLEWSVPLLRWTLETLTDRLGAERVHVLAHSMGSRGVIQALDSWRATGQEGPLIGRLVLLAPDLDTQSFVERLPTLAPLAESISLYVSDTDTPLKLSHQLNGSPRLGQAGEYLTVAEGMETIDVTSAGRYQYLGHEYFYFHPQVGADLVELVTTGRSAAERSRLRARRLGDRVYWEVKPQTDP